MSDRQLSPFRIILAARKKYGSILQSVDSALGQGYLKMSGVCTISLKVPMIFLNHQLAR